MKRYLVFPLDFDSRVHSLKEEQDNWDDKVKELHKGNRENLIAQLREEFGTVGFDVKLENFKAIGPSPFSVVSYHNRFFKEIRYAYVHGLHYPALTGACALGERMLNHMMLTLRDEYRSTPEYKKVYRKKSFDDWSLAVDTLSAWGVLREGVVEHFQTLSKLRNRSIHFNPETYTSVRDDALEAIKLLGEIISLRFGFFRKEHYWAVPGTRGAQFIGQIYENEPFIKHFYIPQCPLVGPYYAVQFIDHGVLFLDREAYEEGSITDEEFASIFNQRSPDEVVSSKLPLELGVDPVGVLFNDGTYHLCVRADKVADLEGEPSDIS